MKIITTILLPLILLTACDPGMQYSAVIQNDSAHDLLISVDTVPGDYPAYAQDSLLIPAHSEVIVYKRGGLGIVEPYKGCDQLNGLLQVSIPGNEALVLEKDLNDSGNWVFAVLRKGWRGSGVCECRLVVVDADIH